MLGEHLQIDANAIKKLATPLTIFIVLRGLDSTALKALQLYGANHPVDGSNPVSFCNVFFFVQLISGVAFLINGRGGLHQQIVNLNNHDRHLLVCDAFLSRFLGPVAYFFSLELLSVITQTLIYALILPISNGPLGHQGIPSESFLNQCVTDQ